MKDKETNLSSSLGFNRPSWKEHIKLTENKIAKTIGKSYIKQDFIQIKEPCYVFTTHIFTPT